MKLEDGSKIIRQFEYHLTEQKLYHQLTIGEHHYTIAAQWIAQFNTPLRSLDGLRLALSSTARLELITGVPIRHGRGRSERGLVKGMGEVVRFW